MMESHFNLKYNIMLRVLCDMSMSRKKKCVKFMFVFCLSFSCFLFRPTLLNPRLCNWALKYHRCSAFLTFGCCERLRWWDISLWCGKDCCYEISDLFRWWFGNYCSFPELEFMKQMKVAERLWHLNVTKF